jgi:hypothetical protein
MDKHKQKLIDHMDRDAQAFGLPTYTQLREALKLAHAALFNDSGDANVFDTAIRTIDAALGGNWE